MARKLAKRKTTEEAIGEKGEILFFYLAHCPHCLRARQLMAQVFSNHPEYKTIPIREINERKEPEIADAYDYYYVPTYYVDGKKVHEGVPTYEKIKAVFEAAAAID